MRVFIRKIVLFLATIILSIFCFCADVSAVIEKKIIANDNETIIYKNYTDILFYQFLGQGNQTLVELYSCSSNNLLAMIPYVNEEAISITKIKDYEKVTLYNFIITYIYDGDNNVIPSFRGYTTFALNGSSAEYYKPSPLKGELITYELKIWIDKKGNTYSGSLTYVPIDLSIASFEGYEYYVAIQDVLIDLIHEELVDFNNDLNKDEPHEINYYFDRILKWITTFDPDTADKVLKQLDELKYKNVALVMKEAIKDSNDKFIARYSSSVSMLQELLASNIEYYGVDAHPDIVGNIPENAEELEKYKLWYSSLFGKTDSILKDAYGIPVLFEITENGLKVTSVGADKEVGTDDDVVYINGIKVK